MIKQRRFQTAIFNEFIVVGVFKPQASAICHDYDIVVTFHKPEYDLFDAFEISRILADWYYKNSDFCYTYRYDTKMNFLTRSDYEELAGFLNKDVAKNGEFSVSFAEGEDCCTIHYSGDDLDGDAITSAVDKWTAQRWSIRLVWVDDKE